MMLVMPGGFPWPARLVWGAVYASGPETGVGVGGEKAHIQTSHPQTFLI